MFFPFYFIRLSKFNDFCSAIRIKFPPASPHAITSSPLVGRDPLFKTDVFVCCRLHERTKKPPRQRETIGAKEKHDCPENGKNIKEPEASRSIEQRVAKAANRTKKK